MDEVTALKLIDTLANGVNPTTGELLAADNPCQQPDVLRALWLASRALQEQRLRLLRQSTLPANVGKPWSEDENNALIAEFHAGRAMADIASMHQRTQAGIQARLEKLGLVQPAHVPANGANGAGTLR
jgi:hypothetical protein